jgi:hypothetical protein
VQAGRGSRLGSSLEIELNGGDGGIRTPDQGFAVRFQGSVNVLQRPFYIWESGRSTALIRQHSLSSVGFAVSFAVKIGGRWWVLPMRLEGIAERSNTPTT